MFKKNRLFVIFVCSLIMAAGNLLAGEVKGAFDLTDPNLWTPHGKQVEVVNYQGKPALQIKPNMGQGYALLKVVEFENGVIEVDIAALPYFTGIVFRLTSDNDYEAVYFRPQNSRHADPEKRKHTVQYISHPDHTWHFLRQNFPDQYEGSQDISPGEWFHVRLEVSGTSARVYVNDAETPCLVVNDLKHGSRKGSVGVWTGNTSGGTFANFTMKALPGSQNKENDIVYKSEQN